ncbi:MAG: hypothetical protein ABR575_00425 [Actinomycetota bacterium]
MRDTSLPEWERELTEDALTHAPERPEGEATTARSRALQLAREQAYHRLAVAIDRPSGTDRAPGPGQLRLFPTDLTLFDAAD